MSTFESYSAEAFEIEQPGVWDWACEAWLRRDMPRWYRFLRDYCGYTAGKSQLKAYVETQAQAWIEGHPTWRKAREATTVTV